MRKINCLVILLSGIFLCTCFEPGKAKLSSYDILFHSERWGTWVIVSDIYGNQYEICPDSSMVDQVDATYCSEEGDLIFSASSSYTHSRNIYKYFAQSNDLIMLTDTTANDNNVSISHDGKFITFVSNRNNESNDWNLFTMNLETGALKQLTYHDHFYSPVYSPDDSKILFHEYYENKHYLSIVDTSSGNIQILDTQLLHHNQFQFSPSGDKIYYVNDSGIASCDQNGFNKELLIENEPGYIYACFTAPIDSLIYYSRIDLEHDLYKINKFNIELKKTTTIRHFSDKVVMGDVSSDNSLLLYSKKVDAFKSRICVYDMTNNTETFITDTEHWDWAPRFNRYLY